MSKSCTAILTTDISVVLIICNLNIILTMNGMIKRSEQRNNEKLDMSGVYIVLVQIDYP